MYSLLINLERRRDRLESALNSAQKNGLSFKRIEAIDSLNCILEPENLVTPDVYACWQSHLKCYRAFLQTNHNYCLILEDDFVVKNRKSLETLLEKRAWENYDLLQVGFILPGFLNKITYMYLNIENKFFRIIGKISSAIKISSVGDKMRIHDALTSEKNIVTNQFFPGTHAYIISRPMAQKILSIKGAQIYSADLFYISLAQMRTFSIARLKKSIFGQSKSAPSIVQRFLREKI
jgi:GR25 family glycosyltransferase involved in LPS biosynthesis